MCVKLRIKISPMRPVSMLMICSRRSNIRRLLGFLVRPQELFKRYSLNSYKLILQMPEMVLKSI